MVALDLRTIVFTGMAGLAGGLITLAVGSSCDVECMPDDRPSIVVAFHGVEGTARIPQAATSVTYRFRGVDDDGDAIEDSLTTAPVREDGYCLDRDCTRWVVGTDQVGTFDIEAVVCGQTVHEQVEVPLAPDGCHPQMQHLSIAVTCPDVPPDPPLRADTETCDKMARPSTFVYVGQMHDDYLQAVGVERVWFEHAGRVAEANCAGPDVDPGECAVWTAGWELEGRIEVFTQWCDAIVSEQVTVGRTQDDCHVETEFVMLPVSTRGCLTGQTPEPDDPTPHGGPDDLTDRPGADPAAPTGADELRIPAPTGDPFGPRYGHG